MKNKVILVIDDSMIDFLYVKNILEQESYLLVHAESGQQGIDMAKQNKPDCILMDVVMPGMNGFQATRHLSRDISTANIPIIMLTSKNQKTDMLWAQRQGARDYLTKPANPQLLINKVKQYMA